MGSHHSLSFLLTSKDTLNRKINFTSPIRYNAASLVESSQAPFAVSEGANQVSPFLLQGILCDHHKERL